MIVLWAYVIFCYLFMMGVEQEIERRGGKTRALLFVIAPISVPVLVGKAIGCRLVWLGDED